MVCRNICERLEFFVEKNYKDGKKYCRRCEIFLQRPGNFCPCCGMALRKSPTGREQKEKLRMSKLNVNEVMPQTGTQYPQYVGTGI
jgi:predicted amidophosphoribosyltransferase